MSVTERTRKNGKTVYEIRISRGRDPVTGKQLAPYTKTFTPPEGCPKAKALKLAQKEEAVFEAQCKAGEVKSKEDKAADKKAIAIEKMSVSDAMPDIAAIMFRNIKYNTIANYKYALKKFANYAQDTPLRSITVKFMNAYYNELYNNGEKSSSIKMQHVTLRRFFNIAVELGYCSKTPTAKAIIPRDVNTISDGKTECLSLEELEKLFNCVDDMPLCWRALFHFTLESGCRLGEVIGLYWEDVELATGEVHIRHNLQYGTEGGGTYITSPKSNKPRKIYLSEQGDALRLLRELNADEKYNDVDIPYVFHVRGKNAVARKTVADKLENIGKKAGLKNVHMHKLRHTMASMAIQAGVDIVTVSKILGHSSPIITAQIYLHSSDNVKQVGAQKLATFLKATEAQ